MSSSWVPYRQNSIAIIGLFLAELAFARAILVPWIPTSMSADVRDSAYTIMSHVAYADGQPWGTEGLHTSGPWGFLNLPIYFEPTYPLVIAANALVAFAIAAILKGRPRLTTCCTRRRREVQRLQ